MRTELLARCPSCDLRLSTRAKRCPTCAATTVPVLRQVRARPRKSTDAAGRWLRRLALAVYTLVFLAFVVGVPLALVAALFSNHPIAVVLGVVFAVGTLSFTLVLLSAALGIVAPLAWLLLAPFAMLVSRGAPPMRWVSSRAEPSPTRRPLAHRVLGITERIAKSPPGWVMLRFLGVASVALFLAALVMAARGIDMGPVDNLITMGMGMICAFSLTGFGLVTAGTIVSFLAKWIIEPPGLHVPAVERDDDEASLVAELRRGERVEGLVRFADERLTSPGSGQVCVAARLRGVVGDARIDDVLAVPFVVETKEGRVDVVAKDLVFALPVDAGVLLPARGEWLDARGIEASPGATLAEGLLLPGARVVVWGRGERGLRHEGYRGAREDRVVSLHDDEGPILVELLAPE